MELDRREIRTIHYVYQEYMLSVGKFMWPAYSMVRVTVRVIGVVRVDILNLMRYIDR